MNSLEMLQKEGLYQEGKTLRLHLGCGQTHLDGYVNIDHPQEKHNVMKVVADAAGDITQLTFPENTVDEIRLHHVYEHFDRVTTLALLVKWHSWLKIDGILTVETPDAIESAKQLSSDISYEHKMAIMRHLEGDQSASWAVHVGQWWDERFENTLSHLGYHVTNIDRTKWEKWPFLSNITVTATKLRNIPLNEQIDKCCFLLKDSMVSDREVATYNVWVSKLKEQLGVL